MGKTHAGSKVCLREREAETERERDERIVNMFSLFVLSPLLWEPAEALCIILCV